MWRSIVDVCDLLHVFGVVNDEEQPGCANGGVATHDIGERIALVQADDREVPAPATGTSQGFPEQSGRYTIVVLRRRKTGEIHRWDALPRRRQAMAPRRYPQCAHDRTRDA